MFLVFLLLVEMTATISLSSALGQAPPMSSTEIVLDEEDLESADFCAMRVLRGTPLITIPMSALATDQVVLHVETGYYTVMVPLKKPRGPIEAVFVGANNLEDASIVLRFFDSPKLNAVRVLTHKAEFRPEARPTDAERQECEAAQLKDRLANCAHCRVREFLFGTRRK